MRLTFPILLMVLFGFAFKQVHAQFNLIPKPQISLATEGAFTLSNNYQVDCLSSDSFLRASLYKWVKTEAIKKAQANKMVQTKIAIQLVGKKKWNAYLKKLTFSKTFEPGAEGYVIKIEKNSILILAQTETGLFYGYQTLKQLFNLPRMACGEIYDKPSFAVRAWQDDISCGPIPNMKQLKEEISTLAHYKLNYFTLYTENVFNYAYSPELAPNAGITANEIRELSKFASLYHVMLIANQQSFGHMEKIVCKERLDFWVAPGVSNWQNIYPNELVAKNNLFNLIRDGYEMGAKGVLNTTWDDGGYALFGNNWRGLIWGAELSWQAPKTKESSDNRWYIFNQAYDKHFWGLPLSQYQNALANLHLGKVEKALRNELFFEPIFPIFPSSIGQKAEDNNKEALNELAQIYKKVDSLTAFGSNQNQAVSHLKFALKEAQFSISKNLFKANYQLFLDHWLSAAQIMQELEQLQVKLSNISSDFEQLYLEENRSYYLQENLDELNKLAKHLKQIPDQCLIVASPQISSKGREIKLIAPLSGAPIYYNYGAGRPLNGSSELHKKPIFTKGDVHINCATKSLNVFNQVSSEDFIYHQAIGKIKHINIDYSKYDAAYSGGGFQALADGKIGSAQNLRSGRWQGYSGNDLELVVAFEKPSNIKEIEMGFYQNTPSWVILPTELQLFTSNDGINYAPIGSIKHQVPVDNQEAIKHVFAQQFPRFKTKYLKVIAKYYGPLPPNHAGAGNASMIFADELIIR
ncbi:MAG: glycoside hydrolase family 20 zincin-like fold domain-containing protein [bacterium]|nr:glycoside hydrolase family 20 zincin-like fold domain-containing protein [bacterium]